jgi:hypothetical protein
MGAHIMIRRLGSSRDLLTQLDKAPRLGIAFDEAFRTLAADIVALQKENVVLHETAATLLREMASLRARLLLPPA